MKSTIQILQDEITPNTLGIFWITESELSKETPLFREFDYFTNGQISNFLKMAAERENVFSKNIFIQKNFGEDSFICHLKNENEDRKESLKQLKSLVDAVKTERNQLIIINKSKHDYEHEIRNLYPKAEIRELNL